MYQYDWSGTKSTITEGLDDYADDCWAINERMSSRGNRSTRRNFVPVPLCPSHTRALTRVAAVRTREPAAWPTALPRK